VNLNKITRENKKIQGDNTNHNIKSNSSFLLSFCFFFFLLLHCDPRHLFFPFTWLLQATQYDKRKYEYLTQKYDLTSHIIISHLKTNLLLDFTSMHHAPISELLNQPRLPLTKYYLVRRRNLREHIGNILLRVNLLHNQLFML
jgi:hypothetical protein